MVNLTEQELQEIEKKTALEMAEAVAIEDALTMPASTESDRFFRTLALDNLQFYMWEKCGAIGKAAPQKVAKTAQKMRS